MNTPADAATLDVAVVGGGWAGLAAAVALARAGRQVTLIEAAPQLGGRARSLDITGPNGQRWTVDNGQHILIGAYRASLGLMHSLGVDLGHAVLTLPLGLPQPGGAGAGTALPASGATARAATNSSASTPAKPAQHHTKPSQPSQRASRHQNASHASDASSRAA